MKKFFMLLLVAVLALSLCACGKQGKEAFLFLNLDAGLSEEEAKAVGTTINQLEEVYTSVYIAAGNTVDGLLEGYDTQIDLSTLGVDVRDGYTVLAKTPDLDGLIQQLEAIEGVDKVLYSQETDMEQNIRSWFEGLFQS